MINATLEKLLADWMDSLTGWAYLVNFYPGIGRGELGSDPSMLLPRCVIACENAIERIKESGIYDTTLVITVTHSADDTTREEHVSACSEILYTITDAANIVAFNQTVPAHIYQTFAHEIAIDRVDRNWQTIITLPIVASLGNMGA